MEKPLSRWDRQFREGITAYTARVQADPSLRLRTPLGCRPADYLDYPWNMQGDLNKMAPLDPGWLLAECLCCGIGVHVGPRQKVVLLHDPDAFVVLCLLCAAILTGGAPKVEHLGGK